MKNNINAQHFILSNSDEVKATIETYYGYELISFVPVPISFTRKPNRYEEHIKASRYSYHLLFIIQEDKMSQEKFDKWFDEDRIKRLKKALER